MSQNESSQIFSGIQSAWSWITTMQNPYLKLFFCIKSVFVIQFPDFFAAHFIILWQTYGLLLARKYFALSFVN